MKKNNLKKIAKDVIELEIKALKKLKSSINNSFDQAVNTIVKCQSKIVLCGVGKSFLIASKIRKIRLNLDYVLTKYQTTKIAALLAS